MKVHIDAITVIKLEKAISDIICLRDNRVLIVEEHGNVNLFSFDGQFLKKLPTSEGAFNVTQINGNIIAITFPWKKFIEIFNMDDDSIIKIQLDKQCWGLSSVNDSLVVGLNKDEIRIIDLTAFTVKSIQVQSKSLLFSLVYSNNRVIFADPLDKAVNCVAMNGVRIWQCKNGEPKQRGLCTGTNDNIIIADDDRQMIISISADGQESELMIENGDLSFSARICIKKNEAFGFFCDALGENLTKFTLF